MNMINSAWAVSDKIQLPSIFKNPTHLRRFSGHKLCLHLYDVNIKARRNLSRTAMTMTIYVDPTHCTSQSFQKSASESFQHLL